MKSKSEVQDQIDMPHTKIKEATHHEKWSEKGGNDKRNKIYIRAKGAKRLDWKRHMLRKLNWEKKRP